MPRILPPVLFFGLLPPIFLFQYLELEAFRALHNTGIPYWEIGITAGLGLLMLLGARFQFDKNNSEINTFKQPRNLVTTGLFRFSRNPMYFGFLLILIACALYVNIWQALLGPLVFFIAANYWYIPIEEKAAREHFGEAYEQYCKNVRRWL